MEGGPGSTSRRDVLLQLRTGRAEEGELGDEGGDTNIRPRWNELLRTRALWQKRDPSLRMGGKG